MATAGKSTTNLSELPTQKKSKTDNVTSSIPEDKPKSLPTVAPGNGPLYFYEDEIFRVTKSGNIEFGMVMENWEMFSSSEDSEDDDSNDKVPKGHVAVSWHPSGTDGVVGEDKVHLSDRSLMPGDVVRRLITGKDTQRGYARSVKVLATVETLGGSKQIIRNIPAACLRPVQKVRLDSPVFLDGWVGTVTEPKYKITLKFSDNSSCTVDDRVLNDHFDDLYGTFNNNSLATYYPGQKLRGSFRHFAKADWIHLSDDLKRSKDRKIVTVTVHRVELKSIVVNWQYKTPSQDPTKPKSEPDAEKSCETSATETAAFVEPTKLSSDTSITQSKKEHDGSPSGVVSGDELRRLKFLNLFESCTVQLGDVSFFSPGPEDAIIKKKLWKTELRNKLSKTVDPTKLFDSRLDETEESETEDEFDETDEGVENKEKQNTEKLKCELKTSCTEVSTTTSSKKKFPRLATKALKKKKLKKARHPATITCGNEKQLVVETIHTTSIIDVVWQDGSIEEGMRSIDLYPIHHLDDHEFFPGDFVTKGESTGLDVDVYGVIQTMDHNGRVAFVKWFQYYVGGQSADEQSPKELRTEEVSVYDIKDHPDFRFRPGTIVFRTGNLIPNQCPAGQVLDNYPDGKVRVRWGSGASSACWPQDLFTMREMDSDDGGYDDYWNGSEESESNNGSSDEWETDEEEVPDKADSASQIESPSSTNILDFAEKGIADELTSSTSLAVSSDSCTVLDISKLTVTDPVEHFIVLENVPESHKFYSTPFEPITPKKFTKTVQRELKMLHDNLPGGIYVKAYEGRMDLYSVMIHGPENTPYQDGIFFFELQLPNSYPDEPPSVHYISFCPNRLNPNLYECGKVCVSLLGTWSGRGTEVWTAESSILQLLISIQGLILVPEPYYNEAGYEKQKGSQQGMENSRMYNEMVLIKLVQSMSKMLKYPPAPWQSETIKHIREQGPQLVQRYQKWLAYSEQQAQSSSTDGTVTGELNAEETGPPFPLFPVSRGFSITLQKMLDNLNSLCTSTNLNTSETPTTTTA